MLNLSNNSGSGSYIRFKTMENVWENQEGPFDLKKCVMDIDNFKTGWLHLAVGLRDWVADDVLGKKDPQPTPDYKRGFAVTLYNKEMGAVEWCTNGVGPNKGIEALWALVEEGRKTNPDKLPVIEYTGSKAEKVGKGNTRIPNFTITSWVKRPSGLDGDTVEESAPEPLPVPTKVVAKVSPKVSVVDEEEFE
jgi:hypothetical protein